MATVTVSEAQIKETVFGLLRRVAPEADFDALDPNEDMRMALDIDSFDFLNFLIALNEALGVEVPEADYGQVTTLSDLLNYLRTRIRS